MSDTATLSAKFQISIPKAVREARKWKAGQKFAFIPKGSGVLLVPVPERDQLAGIAKGAKPENDRDRKDRFLMRLVDTSAWIEWLIATRTSERCRASSMSRKADHSRA